MADGSYTPASDGKADEGAPLETLIQYFESSELTTQDERNEAERDRDYYDGKQLTAAEKRVLAKRGQPAIVINRIKRKVNHLRGVEISQRVDPKASPRNPDDDQAAEAATDALRFVADVNVYQVIRSAIWENLIIEGCGGCEVIAKQKRDRIEVCINGIPWDRFFRDPHSSKPDFSDARYMGNVIWQDEAEALEEHPNARDVIETTMQSASHSDTYDDKPKHGVWADGKRKRIRKVLMYYRQGGKWHWCLFTKGGKIDGGVSPYLDDEGEPENPMIMTSAYVDRENKRYGEVRELISPQDEINKRRSKALHLLSVRQVRGDKGAVDDVNAARREMAKPDGYIETNPGLEFEVLPTGDMAAAQFNLLQQATNEIDLMGPNASMQGKGPQDQSGRAIIAQQQGGYMEQSPLQDRLRQLDIRVYKAIWNRVRQFWNEERWVRVTDDEENIRFVGFNRPVTAGEAEMKRAQQMGLPPEELQAVAQQIAAHPDAQQVVGKENVPAEMHVDIEVDNAPDTVTIQSEEFGKIVELVKGGVPIPPDVLIEASQLRNKKQIIERMKAPSQPSPEQQAGVQLQLADAQAKVEKTQAEVGLTQANTEKSAAQTAEIVNRIVNPPPPPQARPAA